MKLHYDFKVQDDISRYLSKLEREVSKAFEGKWIIVTVEKKRKKRSSAQNRYLWGCLYPAAAQAFKEAGNFGVNEDIVHEFFKDRFLDNGIEIVSPETGEIFKMKPTTTTLTTGAMAEYIMEIQQFLAEFFNVVVLDPGEQIEMYGT